MIAGNKTKMSGAGPPADTVPIYETTMPYSYTPRRQYFGTEWAARYLEMPPATFEQFHVFTQENIIPARLGKRVNVFSKRQLVAFRKYGRTDIVIPEGEIFNSKQAAEYLGVALRTISYHVEKGNLRCVPISETYRIFTKNQLDAFQANRRSVGRPRTKKPRKRSTK